MKLYRFFGLLQHRANYERMRNEIKVGDTVTYIDIGPRGDQRDKKTGIVQYVRPSAFSLTIIVRNDVAVGWAWILEWEPHHAEEKEARPSAPPERAVQQRGTVLEGRAGRSDRAATRSVVSEKESTTVKEGHMTPLHRSEGERRRRITEQKEQDERDAQRRRDEEDAQRTLNSNLNMLSALSNISDASPPTDYGSSNDSSGDSSSSSDTSSSDTSSSLDTDFGGGGGFSGGGGGSDF